MPYGHIFELLDKNPNVPKKESTLFACRLKREQCRGTTKTGARCRLTTTIGIGYCWHHWLSTSHLRIKTVAGKQKGVFVMDNKKERGEVIIKKNQLVCGFDGETISFEEFKRRYPFYITANTYIYMNENRDVVSEDGNCTRGIGTIIRIRQEYNVQVKIDGEGGEYLDVYATRDLLNGEELFRSLTQGEVDRREANDEFGRNVQHITHYGKSPKGYNPIGYFDMDHPELLEIHREGRNPDNPADWE
jgi:hypothetical protein